ncbi:MAG: hypothetical protein JNK60_01080, partial [Acidobacteria bacterium]|nr:hypothetical protein [Acidobacteriota bacterium]
MALAERSARSPLFAILAAHLTSQGNRSARESGLAGRAAGAALALIVLVALLPETVVG